MYQVIIVCHVLIGLSIIGLVLMQQGKGADAGAAFGSGASGTVFGAQGSASFLSRTTAILAALFFLTSLGLAVLSGHGNEVKDIISQPLEQQKDITDLPLTSDTPVLPAEVPSISDTPAITAKKPETVTEQQSEPAAGSAPVENTQETVSIDTK